MMIFLTALATIFIAEMGDKTQLLLVAMAGKYKIPHILTGTLSLFFFPSLSGNWVTKHSSPRLHWQRPTPITIYIARVMYFWDVRLA